MSSFQSAFKLYLSDPVHSGQATIGCFNGTSLSLTCVTNAGKVFVHTPQATNIDGDTQVKYLNINKEVSCIASGTIDPILRRDILLIGTPNNLLAYDVEERSSCAVRQGRRCTASAASANSLASTARSVLATGT